MIIIFDEDDLKSGRAQGRLNNCLFKNYNGSHNNAVNDITRRHIKLIENADIVAINDNDTVTILKNRFSTKIFRGLIKLYF